jgi:hypothetical protein
MGRQMGNGGHSSLGRVSSKKDRLEQRKVLAVFDGRVGGLPRLEWRSEVVYTEVDAAGEPVPLGVEHHAACPSCGANLRLSPLGEDGCRLECTRCEYASEHSKASLSRLGRRLLRARWREV